MTQLACNSYAKLIIISISIIIIKRTAAAAEADMF